MEDVHKKRVGSILEGPIFKTLAKLALPISVGFTLQTLYGFVDLLFISKLGSDAIAAMTLMFIPNHLLYAVAVGPSVGIASLIARLIGAKKNNEATNVANHGFTLTIILSVFLVAFGLLFGKILLAKMGGKGKVLEYAWAYLRIQYTCSIFGVVNVIMSGVVRGEGDMKTSMNILVVSTLVNIVLDPIFIFGFSFIPAMGIEGASIATIIARACGTLWILRHFLKRKSLLKIDFKKFHLRISYYLQIYKIGFTVMIQHFSMVITSGFIVGLVSKYGNYALAGLGISMRIEMMIFIPILGVSAGLLTMVGQNFGAKKYTRVKQSTYYGIMINGLIGLTVGFILFLIPTFFIHFFSTNQEIVRVSKEYLRIFAFMFCGAGISISISHVFQGLGKGLIALISTLVRTGIIGVPMAYILSGYFALKGVWYGLVLGGIIAIIFSLIILSYYFKKRLQESKKAVVFD